MATVQTTGKFRAMKKYIMLFLLAFSSIAFAEPGKGFDSSNYCDCIGIGIHTGSGSATNAGQKHATPQAGFEQRLFALYMWYFTTLK
jgi:hypothetical protein